MTMIVAVAIVIVHFHGLPAFPSEHETGRRRLVERIEGQAAGMITAAASGVGPFSRPAQPE